MGFLENPIFSLGEIHFVDLHFFKILGLLLLLFVQPISTVDSKHNIKTGSNLTSADERERGREKRLPFAVGRESEMESFMVA